MDRVCEKPRDRGRETGSDSYDRTREKERLPATRGKDDEVDWREREKRRHGDRRPNGRASLSEQAEYVDQEYERRKGDTFPRMARPSKDKDGRILLPVHETERLMGIPREMLYESERDRDRERERRRYRDMDVQSERERARYKEDLRRNDIRRLVKDEPERQREREKECDSKMKDRRRESYPGVNDHWSVNERERDRRDREGDRYRQRDREGRYNLQETESFSDKEWRVGRHSEADRNRKRDTKSEGDIDGERGKEGRRKDDYKREPRHYRSEEDSETQQMLDRIRERDRRRQREADRRRELAMQREREPGYQDRKDEHSERCRESERDRMRDTREKRRDYSDRDPYTYTTERIRYKEEDRSRCLEQAEIEEREKRRRESRETERSKHRPHAERTSGCDVENERRRGTRDNLEDREGERGDRQKVEERGDRQKVEERGDRQKVEERMEKEQKGMKALREEEEGGRKEINTGKTKLKKMWLEPQSRKDSSLEEEYIEREKAREKYIQRYRVSKTTGESEKEIIACDRKAMKPELQMEKENLNDNIEEIDREERRGNSRYGGLENEEGSEGESEGERERVMSADDGFVTVSSGGDDAEEDDFEDCKEFWDGGVDDDLSGQSKCMQEEMKNPAVNDSEDHMGKKGPLTVFCVIGQTLPRSQTKPAYADNMDEEATNQHQVQDNQGEVNGINVNEPSENGKYTEENIDRAMGDLTLSSKEDSHDTKWEGGGSYDLSSHNVILLEEPMIPPNESLEKDTQPFPSEPLETLRPCSDIAAVATENSSENTLQDQTEGIGVTVEIINTDNTWDTSEEGKQHSTAPHLKWAKSVMKEILGPSSVTRGSVTHIDMQTNTQTEGTRDMHDWREEKELLGTEVEQQGGMETESNDGSEDDLLDPSSVQHTLSSEGEVESERGETVAENTEKVKEAVLSSSSFRDLGNTARIKRRGFRKTTEKNKECGEEEEVAGDRRTRIFNVSDQDDDDDFSFSWSEVDLRKVTESLSRTKKRNSKFFNSQLYQEYSEVVQNREILLSHSDSIAISRDPSPIRSSSSPNRSPKLPQRPLPPLPAVHLHPHTLSQSNSFNSLVVPQKSTNRPPSPRLSFSPSSTTLWQDLPGVRSSSELGELSEDERRLQEVRFEVVTSEASYCRSLDIVVENFVMSKQLNVLLSSQDKNWLFSRLSDVRAISHSFLSQLEERVESDILHFTVCDIIIKHCPRFRKVYVPYLTNQSYQDKTYQRLMDGNPEFRRVVEKLERNPVCQRLPLRSFLILPFQRITRLKLLVQNIVKRTAPKTKDEAQAIKAMKLLEKMIQDSNDSICQMKNIESLVSLNAKVDFDCRTLPLISQSRRLVREGPATELRDFSMKETERNVYLHLFNDYLLLSLRKEGGRFTVIDHAPVSELRVENCRFKLHSLQKNLFRLYMVNKAVLLRTETQADKLRWISALSRPYPEIDFSAVQDFPQVQCIRAYVAQQPDELNLEKADVLLVHQQSTDGWVEGTRLSDRQRCWAPDSHLETIASDKAKKRNLLDTMKIATAAL